MGPTDMSQTGATRMLAVNLNTIEILLPLADSILVIYLALWLTLLKRVQF